MFERSGRKEVTFEASREIAKPKTMLKPRKVRYYILAYVKIHKFFLLECRFKYRISDPGPIVSKNPD